MQLLAAVGNLFGKNIFYRVEADSHYSRLNVVVVGETSRGRKGTSWGRIAAILRRVDSEWFKNKIKSGLSSGEGIIWAVRDAIVVSEPVKDKKTNVVTSYQDVVTDQGVDDKRLLAFEGEYASILKVMERDGNTLSPTIRNAWDTGNLSTLTKNSPATATDAHISIVAHISSIELKRLLNSTEAANGFANRSLFVASKRSKVLPFGGGDIDAQIMTFAEHLMRVVEFARVPRRVLFDENAVQMWVAVYPKLSEGQPGLVGAITARAEAQVVRLALIYAILDKTESISVEHLEAALAVWNYSADSCRYIFGDATGNSIADEILRSLQSSPLGLTRTEIHKLFSNNKSSLSISQALEELAGTKKVSSVMESTGGRHTERWFYKLDERSTPNSKPEGDQLNSLN